MSYNAGQVCDACTRLYVDASLFDEVIAGVVRTLDGIKIGNGMKPGIEMGPLVSGAQLNRVTGFIDQALLDGVQLARGGRQIGSEGYFFDPTVLLGVRDDMPIAREEIFGPVLVASAFEDETMVVNAANATRYGLATAIWTRDL